MREGHHHLARCDLSTHTGVFQWQDYGPWAASGEHIEAEEVFLFRLADGKIVQMKAVWNPVDFMKQLGLAPAFGQPVH